MISKRPSFAERIANVVALDVRSLAAFRIAIGTVLLADLANRARDFAAMYTEAGLAPQTVVRPLLLPGQWSLYLLNSDAWFQAALLAAAAALAVALMLGYRTRLATIGSWALCLSLHVRLPVVLNAGDTMLRVMLFWSIFLPLGAVWSLDARRRDTPRPTRFASLATAAFMVQLAIIYWLAGWAKLNDRWLVGDALADVFRFGLYGSELGRSLAEYPAATQWMGHATILLELVGPCLLFVPWGAARIRMLLIAAMFAFHLGVAATVTVGMFSYVAMAAWLAILPSEFWQRFAWSRIAAPDSAVLTPGCSCRRLETVFCAAALVIVLYWNAIMVRVPRAPQPIHGSLTRAASVLGLRQSWGVFGRPPQHDCWFVYQARLANGRRVDLLTDADAVEYEQPPLASRQFSNHRWRKLHWRLRTPSAEPYREPTARTYCNAWNAAHDAQEDIVQLDLYCWEQGRGDNAPADQFMRRALARISLGARGGAFADAVYDLGP